MDLERNGLKYSHELKDLNDKISELIPRVSADLDKTIYHDIIFLYT